MFLDSEEPKPLQEIVQQAIDSGEIKFPASGQRMCIEYPQCKIGISRHIHPDRMFLTVCDYISGTMKAVRDPLTKIDVYPTAAALLDEAEISLMAPSGLAHSEPDEPHEVINPLYANLLSAVDENKKLSTDFSTGEETLDLLDMGKRVVTVATIRNIDTLHLKAPRF